MTVWEPLTESVGVYRSKQYPLYEDSLRLVEFARIHAHDRVVDLGAGNGILAIYAAALYGGTYTGVDTDAGALELAKRSAARNGQPIAFMQMDVLEATDRLGRGQFDHVLMNPPYFTTGDPGARGAARHADSDLLHAWCAAAFRLLNNGGKLSVCYPAHQLPALFRALDQNRLAPKRMELRCSGDTATIALVEAKKLGGDGLQITVNACKKERNT